MNQSKPILTNTTNKNSNTKPDPVSPLTFDTILPTNQNAATPASAAVSSIGAKNPKVHFVGAATVVGGIGENVGMGRGREMKRKGKRTFKDIVLQEVIWTNKDGGRSKTGSVTSAAAVAASKSSKRGILKIRGGSESSEKQSLCFVNQAYLGVDDTGIGDDVMCASPLGTVSVTDGSAFPYECRRSSEDGFAGVVELLFQRSNLDSGKRDTHPFGQDISAEAILEGQDAPKRQSLTSAFSKLVLWVTVLGFLAGAAFGLIFLSETYNAKHRYDYLLKTGLKETQNTTS